MIVNSKDCSVIAYPLNSEKIDMAIATVSGRYPDNGRVYNEVCDELAYVVEGCGKIVIENEEITLSSGDVLLIEAGEKYFWEGNLKLFVSCTPSWKIEQHIHVD